jgi:hypothetical protein
MIARVNKVVLSESTRSARRKMRSTEMTWRRTGLTVDRDILMKGRNIYISSVRKDKPRQDKTRHFYLQHTNKV